jgi:hypothetical protein
MRTWADLDAGQQARERRSVSCRAHQTGNECGVTTSQ